MLDCSLTTRNAFFREPAAFDCLRNRGFPDGGGRGCRKRSRGCASGRGLFTVKKPFAGHDDVDVFPAFRGMEC